ncbi:hypothetical protein BDV95DRAFT_600983 [Massariosphaeria phaeospora]|uniref:Uncharacterized protein n=1 Tax=Massariosphaeria phaeospora TaxID=100035 RepID=A0A7C8MJG5_9PLEO|nr:hypothetical protein BDV95DRAFT_600983 [Massariosphaeria phaeospora]
MSAPAGAPPPPPPPPSRPKGMDDLPNELLLSIIVDLSLEDYIILALADYAPLERRGLVPSLTTSTLIRLSYNEAPPFRPSTILTGNLPIEIWLDIMDRLSPEDGVALVFSDRQLIHQLLPPLSRSMILRLWRLWRK